MEKTQKELVLDYIKQFGEICPAKVKGTIYGVGFFGSETPKRCRELRQAGILTSRREGKFEVFFMKEPPKVLPKFRVEQVDNTAHFYKEQVLI